MSICSSTLSMMKRTLNRWLTSLTPRARKPVAMSCSRRCSSEVSREQVAGDLLADELVVRFVLVERLDDVVAVPPRVRTAGGCGPSRSTRRSGRRRASAVPSARRTPSKRAAGRRPFRGPCPRSSARNAEISSGVGGRPVRSNVTRRRSVTLSASRTGAESRSSRALPGRSDQWRRGATPSPDLRGRRASSAAARSRESALSCS